MRVETGDPVPVSCKQLPETMDEADLQCLVCILHAVFTH